MSAASLSSLPWYVRWGLTTTPWRLRVALIGTWLLALLLFGAVFSGVKVHERSMKTVGRDSAPSIIAAQKIKTGLADMHANAANVLLHKPGEARQLRGKYEERRLQLTQGVLEATGNITYGAAEKKPLQKLLDNLGRYEAAVAVAWALHERNAPGALQSHRAADDLMNQSLLPSADALDKANLDALENRYKVAHAEGRGVLLIASVVGLALIGALVGTQAFIYRRMKRIVSPGLAAATLLAVAFLIYTVIAFVRQDRALKVAKEDAFQSIHDLWRARALGYDANGDESRWLLDRERRPAYEKAFHDKVARLAELPPGMSEAELLSAVAKGKVPDGFQGYLAAELRNITFAGEREAAIDSLKAFLVYLRIDANIRKLKNEGKDAEALELCLGTEPGQSNWAFARFDKAVGKTIKINQKEFEQAVARSEAGLAPFRYAAPLAALGVAVLASLGVWPRLREYAIN
jgi:hypothetical protein